MAGDALMFVPAIDGSFFALSVPICKRVGPGSALRGAWPGRQLAGNIRHSGQVQPKLRADPEPRYLRERSEHEISLLESRRAFSANVSLDSRSAFAFASLVWNDGGGRDKTSSLNKPVQNSSR